MPIRHIVLWKIAAEDAAERDAVAAEITERLEGLRGLIDGMTSLAVSRNVAFAEANYDICIVSEYVDVASLEGYQVHPAHQEAAAYIRSVVSGRASIDVEL